MSKPIPQQNPMRCCECGEDTAILITGFCRDCLDEIAVWLDAFEDEIVKQWEQSSAQ